MVDKQKDRIPDVDEGSGTGRWVTLKDLRGYVNVYDNGDVLRSGWLRLARSPDLNTLDLSAHPGRLDLMLAESANPKSIVLPKEGAFLHIQLESAELADLEIRGPVLGCLIEHSQGEEGEPSSHHAFLLDKSNGLILQSTDSVCPQAGIERHVRVDQSGRGLQVKDLRPRVDPGQILWRLTEPARADRCPRTQLLWLARQAGGLDQALAGSGAAATGYRRRLLEALVQPPPADRPRSTQRLPMNNLDLLAWLARSGDGMQALWRLRCGLQYLATGQAQAGDAGSEAVVESANPCWPDRMTDLLGVAAVPDSDLLLFALCQSLSITQAYADRLAELEYPSQVLSLARQAACTAMGSEAQMRLGQTLVGAISSLRRRAVRDSNRDPKVHGNEWELGPLQRRALNDLVDALAALGYVPAIDAFLDFVETVMGCARRVKLGVALHQRGWPQGRRLVARCLEGGERMTAETHRQALECLLSPLPAHADQKP